jgi:hypothetical protein
MHTHSSAARWPNTPAIGPLHRYRAWIDVLHSCPEPEEEAAPPSSPTFHHRKGSTSASVSGPRMWVAETTGHVIHKRIWIGTLYSAMQATRGYDAVLAQRSGWTPPWAAISDVIWLQSTTDWTPHASRARIRRPTSASKRNTPIMSIWRSSATVRPTKLNRRSSSSTPTPGSQRELHKKNRVVHAPALFGNPASPFAPVTRCCCLQLRARLLRQIG